MKLYKIYIVCVTTYIWTIVHDGLKIIRGNYHSIRLPEVVLKSRENVGLNHGDVVISVTSGLLMETPKGVAEFMQYGTELNGYCGK